MTWSNGERLYNLLPAIYRVRDDAQGEPLRTLLSVIEGELERIEADIEGLYDNWFIETCDEWVIPYIADLLGVRLLHPVNTKGVFSQRAYVANTLRYRRRKGTPAVLEQLARDTTGWPARVVEFFQRLGTSQHLNHLRLDNLRTPNLRQTDELELVGTPFETVARTVEVRHIASNRGKYNIPHVGLFVWRLQPYAVTRGAARAVVDPPADAPGTQYTFNPFGLDAPLFNRPQTEAEITHLAEEINTPGPLRRRALYDDLEAVRQALVEDRTPRSRYFGDQPVLQIFLDGNETAVSPAEILICDLSDWRQPPATIDYTVIQTNEDGDQTKVTETRPITVAVDPHLGRITFPAAATHETVHVSYRYGFSSDVGGGPYNRQPTLATVTSIEQFGATVSKQQSADHTTLADAVAAWAAAPQAAGVITILDSDTYVEALTIPMTAGRSLVIQAASGHCPLLQHDRWLTHPG
ncbi:MAG: phage tail protein [Caldilineaceae bacterium]